MKPNDHKFEHRVGLAGWAAIAFLMCLHVFFPRVAMALAFVLMGTLLWRFVLWDLRKKAERRRVIAEWDERRRNN